MALSAATFLFWNLFGAQILLVALHQGNPVSLALQLSCNVLVAGHFTYGVMALSAATFLFWNLFGAQILLVALHQGNPVSLAIAIALQCSAKR
ncbi:hypothetical protein LOK49_LG01G00667 [Camellia lanceoleosa]|uniref:Uncharacterized protein n=1 Tax=Camellia lanceoleosa TaxID=1840588 RepID=A0ACC0IWX6_9ERIC|nr:hypothetical protein LOK49_LG01G00667 [Camellia lanceoleosa]